MQTKLQWDKNVLEPVFRELYSIAMKGKKDYLPMMFSIEGSTKDTESIDGIGGEGLMEEWGKSANQVFYDDVNELWQKYFTHRKFSLGRQIDRDFVDDLKLSEIRNRITSMADAVYKTQQYQGVEDFNNAFVTATAVDFRGRTYNAALPDGKSLCAVDHPYSPDNATEVQSNTGTEPLSIDAWDDTCTKMQEWVDDRGNLMAVMPNTLMVAPYNRRKAYQIAGMPGKEAAKYEPGSADHNLNIFEGDITVIVNPFLKNRFAWFAMDDARLKEFHKWFNRRKPENGSITDFDTEVAKHKVVGRWSYGSTHWSWIFGHNSNN
jgi:hypothetical protein